MGHNTPPLTFTGSKILGNRTDTDFSELTDNVPILDSVLSYSFLECLQEFYKNVIAKADVIQATGDAVVTFTEVQCLTPR